MSDCPNCKDSLLNKQVSSIPVPECADDCPTEVDCNGISLSTKCVVSDVALDCIDTEVGATQTEINQAFDEKLCQVTESNCTASISNEDNCCGFLSDKIVEGDGINVDVITNGLGCQVLQISETCYEWTNFSASNITGTGNYRNKWANGGGNYQLGSYSSVKECTVRLRGTITNNIGTTSSLIGVLPVGRRPAASRRFPVAAFIGNFPIPGIAFVEIANNGEMTLFIQGLGSGVSLVTISLDGIFFEIFEI
jgi:hypothetical protein